MKNEMEIVMVRGRKRLPWIKLWLESLSDPKMARLTLAERGVWYELLLLAGMSPTRGELLVTHGVAMSLDDIASFLRLAPSEVPTLESAITKLKSLNSISENGTGTLIITNWKGRQDVYPSDYSLGNSSELPPKSLGNSSELPPKSRTPDVDLDVDKDIDRTYGTPISISEKAQEKEDFDLVGLYEKYCGPYHFTPQLGETMQALARHPSERVVEALKKAVVVKARFPAGYALAVLDGKEEEVKRGSRRKRLPTGEELEQSWKK